MYIQWDMFPYLAPSSTQAYSHMRTYNFPLPLSLSLSLSLFLSFFLSYTHTCRWCNFGIDMRQKKSWHAAGSRNSPMPLWTMEAWTVILCTFVFFPPSYFTLFFASLSHSRHGPSRNARSLSPRCCTLSLSKDCSTGESYHYIISNHIVSYPIISFHNMPCRIITIP
jgi:hypothetical protein